MEEPEREYLIPDYFPEFKCKIGGCRTPCCEGWAVSISMDDYFRLLGVECSTELRRRLDAGMRMSLSPTVDSYAHFEPRYDGSCPLHLPDGRCGLQAELGEGALPPVCRLYPRGIRLEDGVHECSCANSCEGVLELFFRRTEPISFIRRKLNVIPPHIPERETVFATLGKGADIRARLVRVIQNRELSLAVRVLVVGREIESIDRLIREGDAAALSEYLASPLSDYGITCSDIGETHLSSALTVMEEMMRFVARKSVSVHDRGEKALEYFGEGDGLIGRYQLAKRHFEERFPNWEIFFEHILVNHMFFSVFPYQDRPEDMRSEVTALCAIYALMRFLAIGCMAEHDGEAELIDTLAAAFRLIDHTEFDRYSVHVLKRLGCISPTALRDIVSL